VIAQGLKDLYFAASRVLSLPSTGFAALRYRLTRPRHPEGHYLHLGCGFKHIDGMINVDGNVFRKVELWHDLRNPLPFPNRSCAFVYSSHTLEHLFPYEAIRLLREIRRVLSEDGVARIAVPGMEYALSVAWGEVSEEWPRRFEDSIAQAINYLFCDGQHKYAYNLAIMQAFAREAGFEGVEDLADSTGTQPKVYGRLEVGDEPVGSLVVELTPRVRTPRTDRPESTVVTVRREPEFAEPRPELVSVSPAGNLSVGVD
jgi:predicted SAM-dependent methyltransferase